MGILARNELIVTKREKKLAQICLEFERNFFDVIYDLYIYVSINIINLF